MRMRVRIAILVCLVVAASLALAACGPSLVAGRAPSPSETGGAPVGSPTSGETPTPSSQVAVLPPPPMPTPTPTSAPAAPPAPVRLPVECEPAQLVLTLGPRISEMTVQHTIELVLTNRSGVGCYLFGYPGVSFVDSRGDQLRFVDAWSGDQEVTSAAPTPVELGPGVSAYTRVNTLPCSGPSAGEASAVRVIPPNDYEWVQVPLTDVPTITGCANPTDPGRTEHVSPMEPSPQATAAIR